MAASKSTRPSRADASHQSQINDDDIINEQLQADLDLQTHSHKTKSKKAGKRKSRAADESSDIDGDESPRKKQKEKKRADRLNKSGLYASHNASLIGLDSIGTAMKNGDEVIETIQRTANLGFGPVSLLKAFRASKTPEQPTDGSSDAVLPSESDGGDTSASPSSPTVSMIPLLPEGYEPGLLGSKVQWQCPNQGCDRVYTRKRTLGEHQNGSHRGVRVIDNKDGTFTPLTQEEYEKAMAEGTDEIIVQIPNVQWPSKKERAAKSKKAKEAQSAAKSSDEDISTNDDNSEQAEPSTKGLKPKQPKPKQSKPKKPKKASASGSSSNVSENEMETWEIDPGVITGSPPNSEDDSETEHGTAFSAGFIASAEEGIKLPGFHFQVLRIAPALVSPAPVVPHLRVCSVASGKVQVQVGVRQFTIGPHGMWRIKEGEECRLHNRRYAEAVIHVVTLNLE